MQNQNLIHWWELPPECPIKLNKNCLKKLKETRIKIEHNQRKFAKKYNFKRRTLQNIEYDLKIPKVKTITKLIYILNIPNKIIEKGITHIKTQNKLIAIKFPIKESSLHTQILAHAIFDGSKEKNCCIKYKVRNDISTKELFRKLLVKCFGKDCYGYTGDCYFLYKSFSELLSNHYGIKEFNSTKAKFSKKIINLCKDKKYRRSILKAAFLDEGYSKHNTTSKNYEKFRLNLVCGIKNKKLAKQLLYLTNLENYSISLYSARNNSEFTIPILTKSKKDFYNDIIKDLPDNHRKKIEAKNALASTKSF